MKREPFARGQRVVVIDASGAEVRGEYLGLKKTKIEIKPDGGGPTRIVDAARVKREDERKAT